jgi:hypothetical protein
MTSSDPPPSVVLARLEASILGESALIDRELGRVLWESGGTTMSTLSASMGPKLDEMGAAHIKAKVLTSILLIGILGAFVRLVQSKLQGTSVANKIATIRTIGPLLLFLTKWTILRMPAFHPWIFLTIYLVYMLEAYTSR